jgi:hypothetical protein
VLRSADSVDGTARPLALGAEPGQPGNDGFLMSTAISQFASQMHQTTTQAATSAGEAAEKLRRRPG